MLIPYPEDIAHPCILHYQDAHDIAVAGYAAEWRDNGLGTNHAALSVLCGPNRPMKYSAETDTPLKIDCVCFPLTDGGWQCYYFGDDNLPENWFREDGQFPRFRIEPPIQYPPTTIEINDNENELTNKVIALLAKAPNIYQRGGELVGIYTNAAPPPGIERPADAPTIQRLPPAAIRERINEVAKFKKLSARGKLKHSCVPTWMVPAIQSRGYWPDLPPLEYLTDTPVLCADGRVLSRPGYDPHTGIYLNSNIRPKGMSITGAVETLLDPFADFPFETPAHRSAAIAGVLTPFCKPAYHGATPFFLADGNRPGVGKGLLMDTIATIATGKTLSRMGAPTREEEWDKRITSIAIAGDPAMLIDNISGKLSSSMFEAALTATSWNGRILGESKEITIPLNVVWYGTGNNVELSKDLARRTCHIRLLTMEEHPEERQGFRHPDLLRYCREHRTELISAALSILKGYYGAGLPDQRLPAWGSFEQWSSLVRNAIVWAGLPDPGETQRALRTPEEDLATLIDAWSEVIGVGKPHRVVEILRLAEKNQDLSDAIATLPGSDRKTALVNALRKHKQKVVGGLMLDSVEARAGTLKWQLVNLKGDSL